ncbi:hypothetical protein [Streptococcus suis]
MVTKKFLKIEKVRLLMKLNTPKMLINQQLTLAKYGIIALKIQCPQGRAGSTPAAGIVYEETLIYQRFFFAWSGGLGVFWGLRIFLTL